MKWQGLFKSFLPDVQMCVERHDMVKTPKIRYLMVHDSVAVATRVTLLCSISHSSAKIFFGENLSSDMTTLNCCFAKLVDLFSLKDILADGNLERFG